MNPSRSWIDPEVWTQLLDGAGLGPRREAPRRVAMAIPASGSSPASVAPPVATGPVQVPIAAIDAPSALGGPPAKIARRAFAHGGGDLSSRIGRLEVWLGEVFGATAVCISDADGLELSGSGDLYAAITLAEALAGHRRMRASGASEHAGISIHQVGTAMFHVLEAQTEQGGDFYIIGFRMKEAMQAKDLWEIRTAFISAMRGE